MNANKLIGIMAEQKISQRKLAKMLNLSKNTVNQKLNGKGCFDTEQATQICEILNIEDNNKKAEIFLHNASQK